MNTNNNYIHYSGGCAIGFYYSPSDGIKDGCPRCVRLLKGDKEPFRHGISIELRFKTKEDAVCYADMIADYFDWTKEEDG